MMGEFKSQSSLFKSNDPKTQLDKQQPAPTGGQNFTNHERRMMKRLQQKQGLTEEQASAVMENL